jgi:EmrB/QacA subfamily drug resistance transporter
VAKSSERKTAKTASSRWIVLLITAVATFMSTLDSSIVNVALPEMAKELGVGTGTIAWVVSAYLITITVCVLLFGRLGDIRGQGKIFRFGLVVFTAGSLLCGFSHNFTFLLAARCVQAVGAGATMANSQGIITRTFPQEERGRALGINGAFVALGLLAGPALGGFIMTAASWEYLFWINVPIGIAAFLANLKFSGPEDTRSEEHLDLKGFLFFTLCMVPLFIALEYGQTVGYDSPMILICFLLAAVSGAAFYIAERRCEQPVLDFDIFRNVWFSISIFCAFTSFVALSCSNIILPFYLQNALAMSPGQASLYMTIYPLILALVAPLSGYLSDKFGPETLTLVGLVLTSLGLFLMSWLRENPAPWVLILFIGTMSVGNGLFQSPNNSLVMSMVPKEKLGVGGSVNALVRNLGMVVGIAVSTSILYSGMSAKIGHRVTGYVEGRNDAFFYGMRLAYITAACICFVGAVITGIRMIRFRKKKQQNG